MGETSFKLPSKKVSVKPIMRTRGFVKDPAHEAFFLFANATIDVKAPLDRNGHLVCPLSDEERAFFEDKELSGLHFEKGELSPYKKKGNFWSTYKVKLEKTERLLDLSNPMDYIDYKLLLANTNLIAPDAKSSNKKKTYRYALVSAEESLQSAVSTSTKRKEAYKFAGKMEDSIEEMIAFLKIYGKKPSADASRDFLIAEIDKIITDDIDTFLSIAKDKDRDIKALIMEAVELGVVERHKRKYFMPGGDALAAEGLSSTLENATEYLKKPENQDIYLSIKERVNAAK